MHSGLFFLCLTWLFLKSRNQQNGIDLDLRKDTRRRGQIQLVSWKHLSRLGRDLGHPGEQGVPREEQQCRDGLRVALVVLMSP